MDVTMHPCHAVARAPWFEVVQSHPHGAGFDLSDPLVCELVRWHEGEHADHLGHMGRDLPDAWVWWAGGRSTYVMAQPCEVVDPDVEPVERMACTLFAGHPPGHSWEFADIPHDWGHAR